MGSANLFKFMAWQVKATSRLQSSPLLLTERDHRGIQRSTPGLSITKEREELTETWTRTTILSLPTEIVQEVAVTAIFGSRGWSLGWIDASVLHKLR